MQRRRITISDVRASFKKPASDRNFVILTFGRPPADLLTPFFYNRGWTANQVTVFRSFLACVGLALLATGERSLILASVAVYFLVFVLDCVDGNLARLDDDATYYGKYIDGLGDLLFTVLSPFCAGLALLFMDQGAAPVVLGAVLSLLCVCAQLVRTRLSFFREWMVSQTGAIDQEIDARRAPITRLEVRLFYASDAIRFFSYFVLLYPDPWVFLLFLTAFQGPIDAVWLWNSLRESRVLLSRRRRSKYAAHSSIAK
jgi:phosphatidylglycerophosphate synthase